MFIGLIIFLALLIIEIPVNNLNLVISVHSLIIIIFGLLSFIVLTRTYKEVLIGLKLYIVNNKKNNNEVNLLKRIIHLFQSLIKVTIASSFIAFIVSVFKLYNNSYDINIVHILFKSLISYIYGLLIAYWIFMPIIHKARLLCEENNERL